MRARKKGVSHPPSPASQGPWVSTFRLSAQATCVPALPALETGPSCLTFLTPSTAAFPRRHPGSQQAHGRPGWLHTKHRHIPRQPGDGRCATSNAFASERLTEALGPGPAWGRDAFGLLGKQLPPSAWELPLGSLCPCRSPGALPPCPHGPAHAPPITVYSPDCSSRLTSVSLRRLHPWAGVPTLSPVTQPRSRERGHQTARATWSG